MLQTLSVAKIIEIHDRLIQHSGGTPGVLNEATLHYAIERITREQDPVSAAAFLLHTIATGHPFFDGNKRTAFTTANIKLSYFGYCIDTSDEEVVIFVLQVADNKKTVKDVKKWIRRYIKAL